MSFIDAIIFSFLLFIFRPRKEWPEYFPHALREDRLINRNRNPNNPAAQNRDITVIKTAFISNKLILGPWFPEMKFNKDPKKKSFGSDSSFSSFGSMGTEDPVLILNPSGFTLDQDFPKPTSSFDKIEEEHSEIEDKEELYRLVNVPDFET